MGLSGGGPSENFLGRGTMVGAIVRFRVVISRESLHLGQAGAGGGECGTCVALPPTVGGGLDVDTGHRESSPQV